MTKKLFVKRIINSLLKNNLQWKFGDFSLCNYSGQVIPRDPDNVFVITNEEYHYVLVIEGKKSPMMIRPFVWQFNFFDRLKIKKAVADWKEERFKLMNQTITQLKKDLKK